MKRKRTHTIARLRWFIILLAVGVVGLRQTYAQNQPADSAAAWDVVPSSTISTDTFEQLDPQADERCFGPSEKTVSLSDNDVLTVAGCLTTWTLTELAQHPLVSAEMLEKAKATNLYTDLFSADFYQPLTMFSDNSYDGITLIGVYYTALKEFLIPELLRIVKPGGIVVISCRLQYYASDLQLQAQQFEVDGSAEIVKESQQTYMAGQDADAVYLVLRKK